jgi:hypothetical protein
MAQRPLAWHKMAPIPLLPAPFSWFSDELKKNIRKTNKKCYSTK